MRKRPIDYADYQQQVQESAVRANEATIQVLEAWLNRRGTASLSAARAVKFAEHHVLQRLGQGEFRNLTIGAHRGTCAITGCAEESVLQAAHILPIGQGGTHALENALLLRADVPNLFDLGLITITPSMTVTVNAAVTDKTYRDLEGRPLAVPAAAKKQALRRALSTHRRLHST